MLNVLSGILTLQGTPQMHLLPEVAINGNGPVKFNINPYFERYTQNASEMTENYPMCSLSGRITVNPLMMETNFRNFVGDKEIEISVKEDHIDDLVKNVQKGNYPSTMIYDSALPDSAFAAFAKNQITRLDLSNLLIWHQLTKDYPQGDLTILPLFDEEGNWTPEAYKELLSSKLWNQMSDDHPYSFLPPEKYELLRISIQQQLPPSQQVWRKINIEPLSHKFFLGNAEFSLGAFPVLLNVISGRSFGMEPTCRTFTEEDITAKNINQKSRMIDIPCPHITKKVGQFINPSLFSRHDRLHVIAMHTYSTKLVNALLEILVEFQKTMGESMSEEIWRIGDFDFYELWSKRSLVKDPNEEFNLALEAIIRLIKDISVLEWFIPLYMRAQRENFQTNYQLSSDRILGLDSINQLVMLAEPFLQYYTDLEKIYLLEKLRELGIKNLNDVDRLFATDRSVPKLNAETVSEFFRSVPEVLPQITVERVVRPNKKRAILHLKAKDRQDMIAQVL